MKAKPGKNTVEAFCKKYLGAVEIRKPAPQSGYWKLSRRGIFGAFADDAGRDTSQANRRCLMKSAEARTADD
jgi:hypothetical protein